MSCGIYKIQHIDTGRTYVGRSGNVEQRLRAHFSALQRGKHHNPDLQRAWNDHGADAFTVDVLECDPGDIERLERECIAAFDEQAGTFNRTDFTGGNESHPTTRIAIYFDKNTAKKLRVFSTLEGRPMSRIVDEVVAERLDGWTPEF